MTSASETTPQTAPPSVMAIFGAAGDLTKRKLIPALYNLKEGKLLPENFAVIGVARAEMNDEEFRRRLSDEIREFATDDVDPQIWHWLEERLFYLSGDFSDEQTYSRLKELLSKTDNERHTQGNYLFYLATAPDYFAPIVQRLGTAGLTREEEDKSWRHVVIEKPFGSDLESAKKLNADIKEVLDEHQIYRIDHYLGKETVQNIMVFRFGNGIFEPIWNRRYIDCVQITAAEKVGVEQRGGYYEHAGALRDMVPNHLLQLVTLTAMEPPISFDADAVRDEQTKILHAIQHPSPEEAAKRAVRGQYDAGEIDGEKVPAYRSEPNVAPDSKVETFVALKLLIDNWRWADVPFYLRTGKRLADRDTEIAIRFKHAPFSLFRKTPIDRLTTNRLVLHIQPDEGVSLRFGAKVPGPVLSIGAVDMDFDYEDYFGNTPSTGYERLLYDCMLGDATLFQRADQVEAAWAVVAPIQKIWSEVPPSSFPNYKAGSWGPAEADELLKCDEREWEKTQNVADKTRTKQRSQDGSV
ncbi:MAG TPA: glucose-6-phosphate dehydrogenase [Pyrinomonadaceae bacterium]|nr:glucose-6-phosphate dehydrogenase [Pyrinomonadaceae bacterium]